MTRRVEETIQNFNYENFNALEISGEGWKDFGFKSYTNYYFPEVDICDNEFNTDKKYDIVILEQVLEHVIDPSQALLNIKKILNTGGLLLITTPFLIKIHGYPYDYWRWTPQGLKILVEKFNFDIIELGSWGNKECATVYLSTFKKFREGDDLQNDPELPLVVWCIAKNSE